ncbi:hypothetical protein BU24DRAFT_428674 [Aaosphaeria arxii CBS 175.79]|uniref:Fungal N-terminal domain-containing protein n=1 Tax=Aaosphaeria arxii CBS 175.79 TaxID=1450172 RepID=A0A6A5X884_9PLEO|nr:uncharacterized protein BU24DRAFT_428674 [Aaosphaeria arxii CBS 175.79]KAF2009152.1 hypothetical protein BU24DRAFT_428674 [Aaosphaeria arxii CBS 175.79]
MAEALAILGLTSNLISFIDFSFKVVSGSRKIRQSLEDTTAEIQELKNIIEDVKLHCEQAKQLEHSGRKLCPQERNIIEMAGKCSALVTDLQRAIESLRVRPDRWRTIEAFRIASQNLWRQNDIDSLRNRLIQLDERIKSNIGHIMQR